MVINLKCVYMEVILICNISDINLQWLKTIHELLNKKVQLNLIFDYDNKRCLTHLIYNLSGYGYVKKCESSEEVILNIKKLNI